LVEMRCSKIARRYLRSWFVFDLLLVAFEWFVLLQETDGGTDMLSLGRSGKVIRLMRMMRMLRFLRLVKMMSVLVEFSDFVHSDGALTVFGVLKLLVASFALNHCVACAWYFVGASRVEEWSWVDQFARGAQVEADDLAYYLSALHWSLTQFTPASMEVVPRNTMERAFNIGVIILALLCTSSFLSSITTQMTHLRRLNEEQNRQHELARKYITDHKVSIELGNRLISFVRQHRRRRKTRVHEVDINAFKDMPESLKVDLHVQVYMPSLMQHPLFVRHNRLGDARELGMVCHTAMSEKALLLGHELFATGQVATEMVFVTDGNASYRCDTKDGWFHHQASVDDMLFEAALWVQCYHMGSFCPAPMCELFLLDAVKFGKVMSICSMSSVYRSYAKLFVDYFAKQEAMDGMCNTSEERLNALRGMAAQAFATTDFSGEASEDRAASFRRAAMRFRSNTVAVKSQMFTWFSA